MEWTWFSKEILLFMGMVSVECTNVGVNTLFKAASLKGMSYFVFIFYCYAISTLLLLPAFPFFFRSTPVVSSLKVPLFLRICLLALIGFLVQIAGNNGLEYSSPTLSSAMSNVTPALTFLFAVIFRMEKLAISKPSTQAKIIGTLTSIAGALVAVFYEGPTVLTTASPRPITSPKWHLIGSPNSDWVIGGAFLATQCLLSSFWYIVQSGILKICPAELLVTFIYSLFVTTISAPVCFIAENSLDAWLPKPHIALVAIVYSGIFGPCYSTIVHSWGLRLKGPLYVVIYKPLSIAIAAFMGVVFLGDVLHLGIIVGTVVISMGFYAVIWGKANEEKSNEDHVLCNSGHPFTQNTPLLQVPIEDI